MLDPTPIKLKLKYHTSKPNTGGSVKPTANTRHPWTIWKHLSRSAKAKGFKT